MTEKTNINTQKRFIITIITSAIALTMIFSAVYFIPGFTQKNNTSYAAIIDRTVPDSAVKGIVPLHDTMIIVNAHKVFIKVPGTKKKGTFLMLQGWNLPADDWCNKTSICDSLFKLGYCVVLPDMGKSIYQQTNYPETRKDWRIYPTRQWLTDTLIPLLQKDYSLLLDAEDNYLVGLSTGARGVALLLLDMPKLFKGAAALSGDYNQLKMPSDNLITAYYGSFYTFKKRWKTDNPSMKAKEYNTPLYLGHGTLDKVVPPEQTKMFYDSLIKLNPDLKVKLNMPAAEHSYKYWNSEVGNILRFFKICPS